MECFPYKIYEIEKKKIFIFKCLPNINLNRLFSNLNKIGTVILFDIRFMQIGT